MADESWQQEPDVAIRRQLWNAFKIDCADEAKGRERRLTSVSVARVEKGLQAPNCDVNCETKLNNWIKRERERERRQRKASRCS
jgi:hypothetical protein